jgi:hypothetical protein
MKVLQKNGIQFVQPTPETQAEWRAAGQEVTQKLLEKGLISRQALDQLDSLLKENIQLITDKKNETSNSDCAANRCGSGVDPGGPLLGGDCCPDR